MFKLMRIFNISVYLHWSLLLLVVVLFFNMYSTVAFETDSNMFVGGITTLILCGMFIFSVLWHELAHSLVGKRFGLRMDRITLFVFGGAASIRGEIRKPSHEFWISVAGPLSSFVLGIVFLVLMLVFYRINILLSYSFSILGSVNVVLGIFNLLPFFPMDGGRILRAAIWKATRNYCKATRFAGKTGMAFACVLMLCGAAMAVGFDVPLFGTGIFNGLWTAAIGWVVYGMAKREVEYA